MATPDDKGNMTYDIKRPVAWDYIELRKEHEALMQKAAYFIFGSPLPVTILPAILCLH